MGGIAVRNIERAGAEPIERLRRLGVATVHEAQDGAGLLLPRIRPLWRGARIAGSAVTVLCPPGDNWMIHVAAELIRPGDVLVVACAGESEDGYFGELLATSYRARGAAGAVLDVGCRDSAEITALGFPLWSRAISARGTVKATLGSVNLPVVCAGAWVRPGDVVVADDDGVVVVPRAQAEAVARAGEQREAAEAQARARLERGELGIDRGDTRKRLAEAGLVYVDGPLED